MTATSIDPTALDIIWGTLARPVDGDATSAVLASWLRGRRVLAAVRHVADDELTFAVAVDDADRIQTVAADGRLTAGLTVPQLRDALWAARLAEHVWLSSGDEDDEDSDDEDPSEMLDLHDLAGDEEEAFADDEPGDDDGFEFEDEGRWVTWRFSSQGGGWAHLVAALSQEPITSAVWGGWSAIGGVEPRFELVEPGRADLPVITLSLPEEPGAPGWIEVRSALDTEGFGAFLQPEPTARLTFADGEVAGDAATLRGLLGNGELHPDSALNRVLADPTLAVDAEALTAALEPSDNVTAATMVRAVEALGVPPQLARLALGPDAAGTASTTTLPGGWGAAFLGLADAGLAGLSPRSRDLSAAAPAGIWVRERPAAGAALAGAEVVLGAGWMRDGLRRRGLGRALALGGGLLLLTDGVAEALLVARRVLRARRDGRGGGDGR